MSLATLETCSESGGMLGACWRTPAGAPSRSGDPLLVRLGWWAIVILLGVLALLDIALGIGPQTTDVAWTVVSIALVSPALLQFSTVIVAHHNVARIDRFARYGYVVAAVPGLRILAWLETGPGPTGET